MSLALALFPIVGVSWLDAQEFVKWLNATKIDVEGQYTLLGEAQWEYAARAGQCGKWGHGDDEGRLIEYAWYSKNGNNSTHEVELLKSNAFGLHDMQGNVGEWVQDCYHSDYWGAPKDGSAWYKNCRRDKSRVLRGGSWLEDAFEMSVTKRIFKEPEYCDSNFGFRVARSLL